MDRAPGLAVESTAASGGEVSGVVAVKVLEMEAFPNSSATLSAKQYFVSRLSPLTVNVSGVPAAAGAPSPAASVPEAKLPESMGHAFPTRYRSSCEVAVPVVPSSPTAVQLNWKEVSNTAALRLTDAGGVTSGVDWVSEEENALFPASSVTWSKKQ